MVICLYFPLPDYHSNRTHLYYKTVELSKFSSAVNRADSYMKLKFFIKTILGAIKVVFTEIIKTKQINIEFLAFYWMCVCSLLEFVYLTFPTSLALSSVGL